MACDGEPALPPRPPRSPSRLEAPLRAPRPAPTTAPAAGWDPMGGPGGRRANLPVQSPLFQRCRRVPSGRSRGAPAGEGAAQERAPWDCGPRCILSAAYRRPRCSKSAAPGLRDLSPGFPRNHGCASSRLLSLTCKVVLPSPQPPPGDLWAPGWIPGRSWRLWGRCLNRRDRSQPKRPVGK